MNEWRFIPIEEHNAYMNMAIDESIMSCVKKGSSPATIRLYRWTPSAISIGRFQSMVDEVNIDRCRELGVDHVRRITGGGAVYHDYNGELTYSVIAQEEMFPKGIKQSYALICGWVISGLKTLGIDAQFVPINDIITNGKKISGNAQTRKDGIMLQHGTILYDLDVKKMFSVLNVSKEKISDKMIAGVEERVTCIKRQKDVSFDQMYGAIKDSFLEGKKYDESALSSEELSLTDELMRKYSSDEWNFSR